MKLKINSSFLLFALYASESEDKQLNAFNGNSTYLQSTDALKVLIWHNVMFRFCMGDTGTITN